MELRNVVYLPDGGYVTANSIEIEGDIYLSIQNHLIGGAADGLPIILDELPFRGELRMGLTDEGTLAVTWLSGVPSLSDDASTQGMASFVLQIPRALTEGSDFEILTDGEPINGLGGDDILRGSAEADRILGGYGNDVLIGGLGNDSLRGDAGNDVLIGGEGDADTGFFGFRWQNYQLETDGEVLFITGINAAVSDGTDRLNGIENLVFSNLSSSLDDFRSTYGTDFTGTEDNDVFYFSDTGGAMAGLAGDDTLTGGSVTDTIDGGAGDDSLIGGAATDDLRDNISGGDGNDFVNGGYGNDFLNGDAGDDAIEGGFGADTVAGDEGSDNVTGGALSDFLFGGTYYDFLNGGYGSDRLNGGTGADRFYHAGTGSHGSDWIQDYKASDGDVLQFGGTAIRDHFQVNLAETEAAGKAGVSEAFVIYQPTGQIFWALVDGAAQSEINLLLGGQSYDLLA